jgi:hypothetical protein
VDLTATPAQIPGNGKTERPATEAEIRALIAQLGPMAERVIPGFKLALVEAGASTAKATSTTTPWPSGHPPAKGGETATGTMTTSPLGRKRRPSPPKQGGTAAPPPPPPDGQEAQEVQQPPKKAKTPVAAKKPPASKAAAAPPPPPPPPPPPGGEEETRQEDDEDDGYVTEDEDVPENSEEQAEGDGTARHDDDMPIESDEEDEDDENPPPEDEEEQEHDHEEGDETEVSPSAVDTATPPATPQSSTSLIHAHWPVDECVLSFPPELEALLERSDWLRNYTLESGAGGGVTTAPAPGAINCGFNPGRVLGKQSEPAPPPAEILKVLGISNLPLSPKLSHQIRGLASSMSGETWTSLTKGALRFRSFDGASLPPPGLAGDDEDALEKESRYVRLLNGLAPLLAILVAPDGAGIPIPAASRAALLAAVQFPVTLIWDAIARAQETRRASFHTTPQLPGAVARAINRQLDVAKGAAPPSRPGSQFLFSTAALKEWRALLRAESRGTGAAAVPVVAAIYRTEEGAGAGGAGGGSRKPMRRGLKKKPSNKGFAASKGTQQRKKLGFTSGGKRISLPPRGDETQPHDHQTQQKGGGGGGSFGNRGRGNGGRHGGASSRGGRGGARGRGGKNMSNRSGYYSHAPSPPLSPRTPHVRPPKACYPPPTPSTASAPTEPPIMREGEKWWWEFFRASVSSPRPGLSGRVRGMRRWTPWTRTGATGAFWRILHFSSSRRHSRRRWSPGRKRS